MEKNCFKPLYFLGIKKKTVEEKPNFWLTNFFAMGVTSIIDFHVSLDVGIKILFIGIVPVILEFNVIVAV